MLSFFGAFFSNHFLTLILAACGNNSHHCTELCKFCDNLFHGRTMACLSLLFDHMCLREFNTAMASLNDTDWCVWNKVNR